MSLTYADVRSWDGAALGSVGESVSQGRRRLFDLEDELDASRVMWSFSWQGRAADAARGRIARLTDRGEHLVAEVSMVQRAVLAAADAVTGLARNVDQAESNATANSFTITDTGEVRDAEPLPASDPGHADRAKALTALETFVGDILRTATEIDTALAGVLDSAAEGKVSDQGATSFGDADYTQETADGHYRIGPPDPPEITFDEDFDYDSQDSDWRDHLAKLEWMAKLRAGQLRGDLPDGTRMYEHYWGNSGDPVTFDLGEAGRDDANVSRNTQEEVNRARAAAEELIRNGNTDFDFTGDPSAARNYPDTENWAKAVGGYQQWSHGHVSVDGDQVTMTVTVNAEDRYNFNRGQADIATGAGDNENGRFTEIGWARPFDVHGETTQTVTWTVGDPPPPLDPVDGNDRDYGRERDDTPDNPRGRDRESMGGR
jgi:hypothetical protein